MSTQTFSALKEWPAAINALATGKSIFLFRKGGIHESASYFRLPAQKALLFPTFEHQKSDMLKEDEGKNVSLNTYEVGDSIPITCWVQFIESWEIKCKTQIEALTPFHIWTEEFILNRFSWKPERPLVLLACRAFNFQAPQAIPYLKDYRGCKSWLTVNTDINLDDSNTTLKDEDFHEKLRVIQKIFPLKSELKH